MGGGPSAQTKKNSKRQIYLSFAITLRFLFRSVLLTSGTILLVS